jgi:hypothetical protein
MKLNDDFEYDPEIIRLKNRAVKLSPGDMDIESFFSQQISSFALRRMANDYQRRFKSIKICADIADRRKKTLAEKLKSELLRLEMIIHEVSKKVVLFPGEDNDNGDLRDYLLSCHVDYKALIGVDEERVLLAFSKPGIYFRINDERHEHNHDRDYWVLLVGQFSGPPA